MIHKEVMKNIKRYPLLRVASVLVLVFCFFSINVVLTNLLEVQYLNDRMLSAADGRPGLKLVDMMDETKTLSVFFSDANRLNDLKHFTNDLMKSPELDYCTIYHNPINLLFDRPLSESQYAYDGDKSFTAIDGMDMVTVNAIQITQNAPHFFPIRVSEGRSFTGSDFVFHDQTISIMMGQEYQNDYEIDEIVTIEYWGKILQAKIIGFVDSQSYIIKSGNQQYLDNFIIVPFLSCEDLPQNEADVVFQGISYTSIINGIAFVKDGYTEKDVIHRIDELCRKYDIPPFGFEGMNSNALHFLNYVLSMGADKLVMFAVIIYMLSFISFVILQIYIYHKNKTHYFVHRLLGATKNTILQYAFLDTAWQVLAGGMIAVLLYSYSIGTWFFSLWLLAAALPLLLPPIWMIYHDE